MNTANLKSRLHSAIHTYQKKKKKSKLKYIKAEIAYYIEAAAHTYVYM